MDQDCDVVIIGGGLAGLSAANRALQLGKSVILLEQGEDEHYLCNSRITGGVFHLCFLNAMDQQEKLTAAIAKVTAGFANPELAAAIAADGRRAIRWLQDLGVRFMRAGPEDWKSWVLAPPGWSMDWRGRGGDVMLQTMTRAFVSGEGKLMRQARARSLVMRAGACRGVEFEIIGKSKRIAARAVVIADGGFQCDADLMRQYVTPRPDALKQRNAGTGKGDGLRMALAAGANIVGGGNVYGHLLSREAITNDKLSPFPFLDSIATAGIVVNASGERFMDEGLGGVAMTNKIVQFDDPLSAWVIFDDAIWNGPAREFVMPPNPGLKAARATIHQASTLVALAHETGLPADALVGTVGRYNAAISSGSGASLTPPRTVQPYRPFPISGPPFFAVPLCAGVTYTMGGIEIDANGAVVRSDGTPVVGLYAAGSVTGGLEGGPNAGYVSGLLKAAVFGIRAAEHIAG